MACSVGDLGSIPVMADPLEKEVATHSSILAWETPRTEEPGGRQSLGSQHAAYEFLIFYYVNGVEVWLC